jgi:hypothetical protein
MKPSNLTVARAVSWYRTALLVLCVGIAGCATQEAPPYDKAVADGLTTVSVDTMTLLAGVSAGTSATSFPSREDRYNALIGRVEALALQAGARPMPSHGVSDAIDKLLANRDAGAPATDEPVLPSAHAIRKVAETLTKMRDTDRKQGVTSVEAQAFKGQILIYLDQAITYENALQR